MKKEVTVCDFTNCRQLADNVCVLCGRDFCTTHGNCSVVVALGVERTGSGPDGKNVATLHRDFRTSCCIVCSGAATGAPTSAGLSADTLLQPFSVQAVEYLRACFAAAKLKGGA
jgi:hypothetical protein